MDRHAALHQGQQIRPDLNRRGAKDGAFIIRVTLLKRDPSVGTIQKRRLQDDDPHRVVTFLRNSVRRHLRVEPN
jgi:hypothetical protein